MDAKPSVVVIIPFFQRESGILRAAVVSALGQVGDFVLTVVVVDDGSPIKAHEDLAGLAVTDSRRLVVLEQPNGGPGAARNTGLDYAESVSPDAVAFLDSDDAWTTSHVATGLAALGAGADFYFSNHSRGRAAGGRDDTTWFDENWSDFKDFPIMPVAGAEPRSVRRMSSREAVNAMARTYLSQTSTVIASYAAAYGLRFRPEFRWAGEDYYFWLELAQKSKSVVYSSAPMVDCGRGVNIYYGVQAWDNPNAERSQGYNAILYRAISTQFGLDSKIRSVLKERSDRFLSVYSYLAVKKVIKRRKVNFRLLFDVVMTDLRLLALIPVRAVKFLMMPRQRRAEYARMADLG